MRCKALRYKVLALLLSALCWWPASRCQTLPAAFERITTLAQLTDDGQYAIGALSDGVLYLMSDELLKSTLQVRPIATNAPRLWLTTPHLLWSVRTDSDGALVLSSADGQMLGVKKAKELDLQLTPTASTAAHWVISEAQDEQDGFGVMLTNAAEPKRALMLSTTTRIAEPYFAFANFAASVNRPLIFFRYQPEVAAPAPTHSFYADGRWETFSAPCDVVLPEGFEVEYLSQISDEELQFSATDDAVLPAGTPVLMRSKASGDDAESKVLPLTYQDGAYLREEDLAQGQGVAFVPNFSDLMVTGDEPCNVHLLNPEATMFTLAPKGSTLSAGHAYIRTPKQQQAPLRIRHAVEYDAIATPTTSPRVEAQKWRINFQPFVLSVEEGKKMLQRGE